MAAHSSFKFSQVSFSWWLCWTDLKFLLPKLQFCSSSVHLQLICWMLHIKADCCFICSTQVGFNMFFCSTENWTESKTNKGGLQENTVHNPTWCHSKCFLVSVVWNNLHQMFTLNVRLGFVPATGMNRSTAFIGDLCRKEWIGFGCWKREGGITVVSPVAHFRRT